MEHYASALANADVKFLLRRLLTNGYQHRARSIHFEFSLVVYRAAAINNRL
jgi:hypothetical protein